MTEADEARRRERTLAEGIASIGATGDLPRAQQTACQLVRNLVGGAGWAALLVGGNSSLVVAAVDCLDAELVGDRVTPQQWPLPVRAGLSDGQPTVWAGPASVFGLGEASDGQTTHTLIVPITLRGSLTGMLVAGGDARELEAAQPAASVVAAHIGATHGSLGAVLMAKALLEHTSDLVLVLDADGTIRRANAAVGGALGMPTETLIGEPLLAVVDSDTAAAVADHLSRLTVGTDGPARFELRLRHADGGSIDLEAAATRIEIDDIDGFVLTATDVQERRSLEGELSHRAFYDPLTNLANRALLRQRIGDAVARRCGHQQLALLMIDLDDFKAINDSFGHHEGDRLLVEVAARIRMTLRSADTVARFGGDEFFVLVEDTSNSEVVSLAQRLLGALGDPFRVAETIAHVRASIGIRVAGRHELVSADQLIRDADLAMYAAKARGKATWALYDSSMHDRARAEQALRSELRLGLQEREFIVLYQPIVDLSCGRLVGTEALVRWAHPTRGLLSPNEFIPMAETTGMIVELGAWVLDEACRQTAAWHEAAPGSTLHLNVNLSPRQLLDPGIVPMVAEVLDRHRIAPHTLALEITESMVANDSPASKSAIANLDALGVRIHIDDFGTGYSALGYLRSLPIDAIKIDRSFVAGVDDTNGEASVAEAICHIGQMMNLTLVAEGVERPEQASRLLELGCTLGQGYLYAKPLCAEEIGAWLQPGHPASPTTPTAGRTR